MMALPFVTLAAALLLCNARQRAAAITVWALSLVLILAIFGAHATDVLPLAF
jgi:Family of unknown function (DUF5993)